MKLLLVARVVAGLLAFAAHGACDPFEALPFEEVASTPAAILSGTEFTLERGQALQVVFSRPVIEIGADWANSSSPQPFSITLQNSAADISSIASQRWVTTYILRFDPLPQHDSLWPTDIAGRLSWNREIQTWDGASMSNAHKTSLKDVSFTTPSLQMTLESVDSESAAAATDGEWTTKWRRDVSEVPADGVLQLQFQGSEVAPADVATSIIVTTTPPPSAPSEDGASVRVAAVDCPAPPAPYWQPAPSQHSSKVCVTLSGMRPNTNYWLTLPEGARYNPFAGALRKDLAVQISSTLPFTTPFRQSSNIAAKTFSEAEYYGSLSRRLQLFMPHGLNATTEAAAGLVHRLRLTDHGVPFESYQRVKGLPATQVPVDLEINATVASGAFVWLLAPLLPAHSYTLQVLPVDSPSDAAVYSSAAFGEQPLETREPGVPDSISFTSRRLRQGSRTPFDSGRSFPSIQERAGDLELPVLTQGDSLSDRALSEVVVGVPVAASSTADSAALTVSSVIEGLFNIHSSRQSRIEVTGAQLVEAAAAITAMESSGALYSFQGLDLSSLLQPTSLVFIQTEVRTSSLGGFWYSHHDIIVSGSNISLGFITTEDTIFAWATSNTDGQPVPGVSLTLYSSGWNAGLTVSDPVTTDVNGTAELPLIHVRASSTTDDSHPGTDEFYYQSFNEYHYRQHAVAAEAADGQLMVVDLRGASVMPHAGTHLRASLFLDRTVVGTGHKLHVSGFLRVLTTSGPSVPTATGRLVLCHSSKCTAPNRFPVSFDATYGSFNRTILFDESLVNYLGYNQASLVLSICMSEEQCEERTWQYGDSATVTIADPRPPTAELTLSSPVWTAPNTTVLLNGTAESLLGADVAGAKITITWTAAGSSLPVPFEATSRSGVSSSTGDSAAAVAVVELTAGEDGSFSTSVDLQTLTPPPQPGTSLSFDAVWIGPTRERLTAASETHIQYSEHVVELTTSVSHDKLVPLQEFSIVTQVNPKEGLAAGSSITVYAKPITQDVCDELFTCGQSDPCLQHTVAPIGNAVQQLSPSEAAQLREGAGPVCNGVQPDASTSACRWELPDVGLYAITACLTEPGDPSTACSVLYVGKSQEQWALQPLDGALQASWSWELPSGETGFAVNDLAQLVIDSPVTHANAMLVWASPTEKGTVLIPSLVRGLNTASFVVQPSCMAGCSVAVLVSWPRLPASPFPATVAVHPTVDTQAAIMQLVQANGEGSTVPVLEESRTVQVDVIVVSPASTSEDEAGIVEPSSTFKISVDVTHCSEAASCSAAGGQPVQVTVFAVSKAWLLLQPYELPDFMALFETRATPSLGSASSTGAPLHPDALDLWKLRNTAVLEEEPWAETVELADLHEPTSSLLERTFWPLHDHTGNLLPQCTSGGGFTARGGVPQPTYAAAAVADAETREFSLPESPDITDDVQGAPNTGTGAGAVSAPRRSSPLDTVPFFHVLTVTPGQATEIEVTAPSTLSTYVVHAVAASSDGQTFGTTEAEFTVRRPLSLTASVPRLLRVGDSGSVGVIVTFFGAASEASPAAVTVTVEGSGRQLTLTAPDPQQIQFTASGSQQEVRFPVLAEAVGEGGLLFSAVHAAASDSLEVQLETLIPQAPVVVASSFPVTQTQGWKEGLVLPQAVPGSGELGLVAGVGNLSPQIAMAKRLLGATPDRRYATADWALSVLVMHSVISAYGGSDSQPLQTEITLPRLPAARLAVPQTLTLCEALGAAIPYAVASLNEMSSIEPLGLMNYVPNSWPGWRQPQRPDVGLNLMARLLLVWSSRYGKEPGNRACSDTTGVQSLTGASAQWLEIGMNELFRLADLYSAPPATHVALLWAVKAAEMFNLRDSLQAAGVQSLDEVEQLLSLTQLVQNESQRLSVFDQALVSLTLSQNLPPGISDSDWRAIRNGLNDLFRITARSAYVSYGPGAKGPADSRAQAATMLSVLAAGEASVITEKHSNYLASRMGSDSRFYTSEVATALTMMALAAYDESTESRQPALSLTVTSQPAEVLSAEFSEGKNSIVEQTVSFDELANPPNPLIFRATGTGQASVAAVVTFVPAELPKSPQFRGLHVDLVVRSVDAATRQPVGAPLTQAPLGSTLHVLAQVTSLDAVGKSTVRVLMPGGLEPIDGNLDADGAIATCQLPWYLQNLGVLSATFWAPSCPRVETTAANVTFHLGSLTPGTHDLAFLAIAASPGEYVLPPAISYVNSQPEVMGLSASQLFTVCAAAACTVQEVEGAARHPLVSRFLQSCPNSCSGAGLCDSGTGRCSCDSEFAGADCSILCDGEACAAAELVDPSPPNAVTEPTQQSSSTGHGESMALIVLVICAVSSFL